MAVSLDLNCRVQLLLWTALRICQEKAKISEHSSCQVLSN